MTKKYCILTRTGADIKYIAPEYNESFIASLGLKRIKMVGIRTYDTTIFEVIDEQLFSLFLIEYSELIILMEL